MEVTKTNFQDVIPKVKIAISKSDFIAIDCEFTGLNVGSNINGYDTQAQYYEKMRKASKDFLVIQYGLCIFRYDYEQKKFKQQGYNFYIYPRPTNKLMPDRRFLCQSSSLDFLISEGFDFNKLFKEGIPYLNSTEEDKYREELLEKQKTRANQIQNSSSNNDYSNTGTSITVEDKLKVDDIFNKIEQFISGTDNEFILPRCNAFIRRLVYGEAATRLENRASLETRVLENKDRVLVVTRAKSKKVREEEDLQKVAQEEEEFKACIGFAEVIKCIVESGKLVVGHNMLLDLLHTIEKFLIPLPGDYDEFKDLASSMFSNLVDTKYMSSIPPFSSVIDSSVLPHLLDSIKKKPFSLPVVEIEEGTQGYKLESVKSHEAGYDSFITGMCFLAMWNYLGIIEENEDPYSVFSDHSALKPYTNKLFVMRIQDIPYIHLGGEDVVPRRDNVLYVTFPKEWKHNNITQLFSPFGSVNIVWIDERSAYVGLSSVERVAFAVNTLSHGDTYTVTTYSKRQAQLEGNLPRKGSSVDLNISSRKRCSSLGSNSSRKRSFNVSEEDSEESFPGTHRGGSGSFKTPKKMKKAFNEDTDWT